MKPKYTEFDNIIRFLKEKPYSNESPANIYSISSDMFNQRVVPEIEQNQASLNFVGWVSYLKHLIIEAETLITKFKDSPHQIKPYLEKYNINEECVFTDVLKEENTFHEALTAEVPISDEFLSPAEDKRMLLGIMLQCFCSYTQLKSIISKLYQYYYYSKKTDFPKELEPFIVDPVNSELLTQVADFYKPFENMLYCQNDVFDVCFSDIAYLNLIAVFEPNDKRLSGFRYKDPELPSFNDKINTYLTGLDLPVQIDEISHYYSLQLKKAVCSFKERFENIESVISTNDFQHLGVCFYYHFNTLLEKIEKRQNLFKVEVFDFLTATEANIIVSIKVALLHLVKFVSRCTLFDTGPLSAVLSVWHMQYLPNDIIQEIIKHRNVEFKYRFPHSSLSYTDLIPLYENQSHYYSLFSYSGIYDYNRLNGLLSLREWVSYKDRFNYRNYGNLSEFSEEQIQLIKSNEQQMYEDFVDVIYNNIFLSIFEKSPEQNKELVANNDLAVIGYLINNEVNEIAFGNFERCYKCELTKDFSGNLHTVLRGLTFETNGYKLLSLAAPAALLKYKVYLTSFLSGKNDSSLQVAKTSKYKIVTSKETPSDCSEKNDFSLDGFSFGCKGDQAKLLEALKSLHLTLTLDLVNESYSTVDDLYNMLTSTRLSIDCKPIHFSCETNQLAYIIKRFSGSFDNLNEVTVGASKLFITRKSKILQSGNIKSAISKCKNNPHERAFIDKAIADFIKIQ